MASTRPHTRKGNLLMALPPELRNEIYAQVITCDFYELDPTVSAKTFPRPRYGIFGIQRGIKAQGGTPSIAQTCQQIRAEALDVYYGRNSFALIGDDTTAATKTKAVANRTMAHQWMQLIGDDAKFLRRVRFSLEVPSRNDRDDTLLVNCLVEVQSNTSGDAPTVTAIASTPGKTFVYASWSSLSQHVQTAVQKHLAETGDMGKVWRAVVERALYPVGITRQGFYFDISEGSIAQAEANAPIKRRKAASKKHLPTKVNPPLAKKAVPSGQFVDLRQFVDLDDDSDEWQAGAPPMKKYAPKSTTASEKSGQDEDSDVIEVEAPVNKAKAQRWVMQQAKKPAQKPNTKTTDQDDDSDVMEIEPPAKKPKTSKTAKNVTKAGSSTSEPNADVVSKRATRASTRKKVPRKLLAEED